MSEPASAGRYLLYKRCSYRETVAIFFSEILKNFLYRTGILRARTYHQLFHFLRRNARSHTKYPISDTIIGTSVFIGWLLEVGWLRGSGPGWDFRVEYLVGAAKGVIRRLRLAGVGITSGNFRRGRTLDSHVLLSAAKLNAYRSRRKVKGACPVRAQRVCLYYEPPGPYIGSCTCLIADVRNLHRLRTQLTVRLSVTFCE